MSHFALTLSLLFVTCFLSAQSYSLTGTATDAENRSSLPGAYVILEQAVAEPFRQTTTDSDGKFLLTDVPDGAYTLRISFLGYGELKRAINVNGADRNLGDLALSVGIELAEIEVTEKVVPVTQKGDTTVLEAAAYKTLADASAEDLVEKMPTITTTDGKLQAQGEDVKRVLVDGKPFFGDDPTATLRNLPAEVIQRIEIFDQESEQAAFTGFDDGETSKTINIITKATMRNGTFGQAYGGYGTDDRYEAGFSLNNFSGDRRLSLVGLSNNLNRQNFSAEDLLGVTSSRASGGGVGRRGGGGGGRRGGGGGGGGSASDFLVNDQTGIVTSNALGLNYSDQWGEDITVSGSYFFNRSAGDTDRDLTRQFFDAEGLQERYEESALIDNTNTNHRLNGRVEWKIDDNNSLLWQPRLSWQGNDGIESSLGETYLGNQLLYATENNYAAQLTAANLNNSLLWRHRFSKPRRTLSINLSGGFNPTTGDSQLAFGETGDQDTTVLSVTDQISTLDQEKYSGSVRIQYTEPIGQNTIFTLNSRTNLQREDSEQLTFARESGAVGYDELQEELSGIFTNDYLSQEVGGGFSYRKQTLNISGQAAVQYADLMTESAISSGLSTGKTFWSVLPSLRMRFRPSRNENFNFSYRSSTDLPSIDQLQNVVSNDNPLFLTVGNPDLVQATGHRMFARYNLTLPEKSSIFFALLGGEYTSNAISTSTFLSGEEFDGDFSVPVGSRISLPVNLSNNWNLRALTTYGFPVNFLKSNLNLDLSANYRNVPGLINGVLNLAKTTTTGVGLTLASNISDRLDFTLSSRTSGNWLRNDLQPASNDNYLSQQTSLKFGWVIGGTGIVIRTNFTHQLYRGLDESFDQDYMLWNASIGKKLFKDDRGEISLTAFDLLNENTSLTRNVTESYYEDVNTNTLQQYVKLGFKYDIRSFN